MKILTEQARNEIVIKGSRFIGEIFPVTTQAEAREKLQEQKKIYSDATHVVHAFVVGLGAETCGMSDDGEPSGTAGRPVLDVLKGSGITNIILTVTRYFGGTLLGTGGLVHAYSDSAKEVLALAKAEEYVKKTDFDFSSDYSTYETIKRLLAEYHVSNVTEEYSADVHVSGTIYEAEKEDLSQKIKNLSKGKIIVN